MGCIHRHTIRPSSTFIECHRRVSIINHLHCNRTAQRSDMEAPDRSSVSTHNSQTTKSFQSTQHHERQWKCVVLQSAAIYSIRQRYFAQRNNSPVQNRRDYERRLPRYAALRRIHVPSRLHRIRVLRNEETNDSLLGIPLIRTIKSISHTWRESRDGKYTMTRRNKKQNVTMRKERDREEGIVEKKDYCTVRKI